MVTQTEIKKMLENGTSQVPHGEVYVVEERCKGCGLCIAFCPKHVLVQSDRINEKGYHPPELVERPPTDICIGCGMCERICPDFAIFVKTDNDKERDESEQ